jgi:hypothetical protein
MSLVVTAAETTILCLYIMSAVTCSSTAFALDGLDVAVLIEVITVPRGARLLASGCPFGKDEKPKRRKGADEKKPVKDQSQRQEHR